MSVSSVGGSCRAVDAIAGSVSLGEMGAEISLLETLSVGAVSNGFEGRLRQ